jgi:serine/threonine-protein kinase
MSAKSMDMTEPHELAPGDRLDDKYTIKGTLGAGGTAIVFSAIQEDLQRLVAIKVIRRELVEDPDAGNRLMSEAITVARIRGEHAARILDVGQLDNGCPYIVMEHLEGNDFASLLDQHGPAPFERVVDWILQASVAIAEAHSLGVIHRDLKPQNLYLADAPRGEPIVKVLDFGISTTSRLAVNGASTGEFKRVDGSPHYMSPEQMQALAQDARSDIWGLGVLMFELLTGEVPFHGDTFEEICTDF